MAIRGHVVLLDAWVPRGAHSGYVPVDAGRARARCGPRRSSSATPTSTTPPTPCRSRRPPAHDRRAAPSSARSCARAPSRRASLRRRAARRGRRSRARGAGAAAASGVEATIVKHAALRCAAARRRRRPARAGAARAVDHERRRTRRPPQDWRTSCEHLPDAEGGTVLYRFRVGDFSLVWNDSAGPLADTRAAGVRHVLRRCARSTSRSAPSRASTSSRTGCATRARTSRRFAPRDFVPAHHDDWFPARAVDAPRDASEPHPAPPSCARIPRGAPPGGALHRGPRATTSRPGGSPSGSPGGAEHGPLLEWPVARRLLILGSTGSIGTQALDVVSAPDDARARRPAAPSARGRRSSSRRARSA